MPWSQTTWRKNPQHFSTKYFFPFQIIKGITAIPHHRNHCYPLLNSYIFKYHSQSNLGWKVSLGTLWSNLLSTPGQFKLGCLELCSVSLFVYKRTEFPQHAKLVPVLNYPQCDFFPTPETNWNFPCCIFLSTTLHSVIVHLEEKSGSVFSVPSH